MDEVFLRVPEGFEVNLSPIEQFAARNPQTVNDPAAKAWTTKIGGIWQVGTLLYRNDMSLREHTALPKESFIFDASTFSTDDFSNTQDLPFVVKVARLPACNEKGVFNLRSPVELQIVTPSHPNSNKSMVTISAAAAQFFYQRAPQQS